MRLPVKDYDKWYSAQHYGDKTSYGFHDGVDLNLKTGGNSDLGQPIYAIADGTVTSVHRHLTSWGKHIHISHVGAWGTCYSHSAHCDFISVKTGDVVKEGQIIAKVGNSGNSTAAHLHFCIKKKPTGVDSVARTLGELRDGWYDPIPFINKYSEEHMGQSPELKECLSQHLKLVNEAVEKDKKIATLESEIEALKLDAANMRKAHDDEIKKIKVDLDRLFNVETDLQKEIDGRRTDNLDWEKEQIKLEGDILKLKQRLASKDLSDHDWKKLFMALMRKVELHLRNYRKD